MRKSKVLLVIILTFVWIILIESVSLVTVLSGAGIGIVCVLFSSRFLPLERISGVSFGRIALYPLYLVGQVFVSAVYVTKIIFKGAKIDIVSIKTCVKNDSVRVMLADSVTLTPGSVMLELDGEDMTILWLRERGSPEIDALEKSEVSKSIMGKLEKKLLVAQEEGCG